MYSKFENLCKYQTIANTSNYKFFSPLDSLYVKDCRNIYKSHSGYSVRPLYSSDNQKCDSCNGFPGTANPYIGKDSSPNDPKFD